MKKETRNTLLGGLALSAMTGVLNPVVKSISNTISSHLTYTVDISSSEFHISEGIKKYFKDIPDKLFIEVGSDVDDGIEFKYKKNIGVWDRSCENCSSTIFWNNIPITFRLSVNDNKNNDPSNKITLSTMNTPVAKKKLKQFMKVLAEVQHEHDIKNEGKSTILLAETNHGSGLVQRYLTNFKRRTFENTFIPSEHEMLIKESIDTFKSKREWYMENNIPYHFGFLLYGEGGTGKAEPLSNKIPTPTKKGYTLMGDLKVGDYVFDINGMKTQVTQIFDQGERDVYTVTFNDGRKINVSDEHLFGVYTMSHGKEKYSVRSVADMSKDYKRKNQCGEWSYRYKVPRPLPVNYPSKNVPVHPWVLGCFIGNGCCKETALTISSGTPEIPNAIARIYNFTCRRNSEKNYNYNFRDENGNIVKTKDFFKDIPEIIDCYSRNKKIPEEYIHNDIDTRLQLIQGLMDTDGCVTISGNRFHITYSSTSKSLLKQMRYILYSFGFSSTICVDKRGEEKYVGGFCGTLNINISNKDKYKLFSLARKRTLTQMAWKFGKHYATKYDNMIIKDISFSHKEKCKCIMVDSPMHLYLTENFIVTHNTSIAQAIAEYADAQLISFPGDRISELPKMMGGMISTVSIDKNSYRVILIEDIDCGFAEKAIDTEYDDESGKFKSVERKVGLASILNALDGMAAPTNAIYVFTTNHIEKLDPAIIRPGRCDVKLEIPTVTRETFIKFCKYHYGVDCSGIESLRDDRIRKDATFAELQTEVMKGAGIADLLNIIDFTEEEK